MNKLYRHIGSNQKKFLAPLNPFSGSTPGVVTYQRRAKEIKRNLKSDGIINQCWYKEI